MAHEILKYVIKLNFIVFKSYRNDEFFSVKYINTFFSL